MNYLVIDWKLIRKISYKSFSGDNGIKKPTEHLPNCNHSHYSLQLNLYEFLLKSEGYIPVNATVRKVLNWYNDKTKKIENISVRDMPTESAMLAAWNVTAVPDGRVPF
jgi:hypothetical protein